MPLVKEISLEFSLEIIELHKKLYKRKDIYSLSLQLLRSATSVGAMIREANFAESKADFIHKMSIALKEANESYYWLELLKKSRIIEESTSLRFENLNLSLIKMLVKIIKRAKINSNKKVY